MIIGIDASRAFQKERTGVEEYSYQVIRHLANYLKDSQVVLYIKKSQKSKVKSQNLNSKVKNEKAPESQNALEIPPSWKIKIINFPFFWTQIGLSLEMLFHPVDALFVPSHTVPAIRPKNTIVTIHGLEYETFPSGYSFWSRLYMRFFVKKSCQWAQKIIAVSENTQKDLIRLYKIPEDKIKVVYEGCGYCHSRENGNPVSNLKVPTLDSRWSLSRTLMRDGNDKYFLFVGRIEERKNIVGMLRAFEILKERYKIPHKLILAGKPGYGYSEIINEAKSINFAKDVVFLGFVGEEEKRALLEKADLFLFPTFYEGFGLPVLEAQAAGVPVVASDNSSIREITKSCHCEERSDAAISEENSAVLVDPHNAEDMADAINRVLKDESFRNDLIAKGRENSKKYSWEKCAGEIAKILT